MSEAVIGPDGETRMNTFTHHMFLLSSSADSPARQKLANWPGVQAYIACGWCAFEGFKREGDKATRFAGYAEPAEQTILDQPACKVGDSRLQLSDAHHHARGLSVEQGEADPSVAGCTGYSVFPQTLSYISYNDFWELPIFHAGEQSVLCVIKQMAIQTTSALSKTGIRILMLQAESRVRHQTEHARIWVHGYTWPTSCPQDAQASAPNMLQYWQVWLDWVHCVAIACVDKCLQLQGDIMW